MDKDLIMSFTGETRHLITADLGMQIHLIEVESRLYQKIFENIEMYDEDDKDTDNEDKTDAPVCISVWKS